MLQLMYLLNYYNSGWAEVQWDNGERNSYRCGAEGKHELRRVSIGQQPPPLPRLRKFTVVFCGNIIL